MIDTLFYKTPDGDDIHSAPAHNVTNSFLSNWECDTNINGIDYHFLFYSSGAGKKKKWLRKQIDGSYLPCNNIEIIKLEHIVEIK